ncbi:hypothetical protein B2J88_47180 [Rhodococcus sp. SRB_17]|nr:hypothetical protein [Rhodococcus sp. SRB_17]
MALTADQADQRFDELFDGDRRPDAATDSELVNLVALRDLNTAAVVASAAAEYWPPFFNKDASAATRDTLLARLEQSTDTGDANQLLLALAFVGDATVVERFHAWEDTPHPWQALLHVGPRTYAHQAGWTLGGPGVRRELTFPGTVATRQASDPETGATIGGLLLELCPSCGASLVNALTLDGTNAQFDFLGLPGMLRIPACAWCSMFNDAAGSLGTGVTIWVRYPLDGTNTLDVTGTPDHDRGEYQETMNQTWSPDPVAFGPWRAQADVAEVPIIGGQPMWLQDAEYAACPDCANTMRHLAWIPLNCLVVDGAEGIWYVQACPDCQVATVIYQQT